MRCMMDTTKIFLTSIACFSLMVMTYTCVKSNYSLNVKGYGIEFGISANEKKYKLKEKSIA